MHNLLNMACVCNMADIDRECGRNAPGLQTVIYLACVDDISAIGAATSHVVSTITPVTDMGFYKINIIRKDNDMKSEEQDDGGYNTTVKGVISKQTSAKAAVLTNLATEENYIGISIDQNGLKHILGSLTHPIKVRKNATTTPKNGYELSLIWEGHADLPYHFSGSVPLPT